MKKKILHLDVDFIGGQDPLTVEEEKALSDFFKKRKLALKKSTIAKKRRIVKKSKSTV